MAETEKKTPVKKTVTRVDSVATEKQPVRSAPKAEAKAAPKNEPAKAPETAGKVDPATAKTKRILAWVFWILAFACEVMAFLVFLGKVDLHFCSQTAQLIGFLVIDFILVVVGAQFWKKANRIDPMSESKKFRFWLWNNMGVIVCCVAFLPFLIYVLFFDKKADPKLKKVAAIAAAIALALGIGLSYDWNPVSEEGLAKAEETLSGVDVYWTEFGSVYHTSLECQHLNRSSEAYVGDVATAVANGKTRLCKTCAKNSGIEIDDNGAVLSAVETLTEEVPAEDVEAAEPDPEAAA